MNDSENSIPPAIHRLKEDTKLLNGAISGLELLIRRAEDLDQDDVRTALPFLSLIWLYGSAIRDLLDSKRSDGTMLWNAPAIAALCRPLQEAFLSLFYFSVEEPGIEEAAFRQLLLRRHMAYKRWDLLRRADQSNSNIARECVTAHAEWEAIHQTVCCHPHMKMVSQKMANKVINDSERYILCSLDAVWERAGMPRDLYDVTFRYLSQYAHATPYAAASLKLQTAGHEDGAVSMMIPLGLALVCVAQAIQIASKLHASLDQLVPPAFWQFVEVSRTPT